MKRRNLMIATIALLGVVMASCSSGTGNKTEQAETAETTTTPLESVAIDRTASKVVWEGEMLGIYSHNGTVDLTEASIAMEDGKISGGSFTVDMSSMIPTDDNYNPEEGSTPEKLVGHLSSPDFFDVSSYPTARFEIQQVNGNTASGMLTVRGKTHPEKVENIAIKQDGESVKIVGDLVFDRKKYDVSWDSPVKDRILSNDIKVKIELIGS